MMFTEKGQLKRTIKKTFGQRCDVKDVSCFVVILSFCPTVCKAFDRVRKAERRKRRERVNYICNGKR